MRKIRSGDTVLVTSGKNKGQQGTVRLNLIDEIGW
jgi:ribosomal protein L24